MVIFEENVVSSDGEIVLGIRHESSMQYVDAFYALNRGWEEKLTLVQRKGKIVLSKSKVSKNGAEDNTFFMDDSVIRFSLSGNSLKYMVEVLMRFHHFSTMSFNHIHIECHDVNRKRVCDFTLVFDGVF